MVGVLARALAAKYTVGGLGGHEVDKRVGGFQW